jgi:hypothetical protein
VLNDLNVFISVMLANAVGIFSCLLLYFDMLMACNVLHRFQISLGEQETITCVCSRYASS